MRYLGIIIILIGVLVLGLYAFSVIGGNGALVTAGVIMVIGLLAHIFLNKRFLED